MKNIYGVSFTAQDIERLNKITMRVEEMRASAYERAVKLYTQAEGEKASVLSQKISEAEKRNLVIIRPTKVDIDINEIRSKDEFKAKIKLAEYEARYGVEERTNTYIENYIQTLKQVYGSTVANRIAGSIRNNPEAFIDAINARDIRSITYHYKVGESEKKQVVEDIKDAINKRSKKENK